MKNVETLPAWATQPQRTDEEIQASVLASFKALLGPPDDYSIQRGNQPTDRKDGFYWLRVDWRDDWIVCEWSRKAVTYDSDGCWLLPGRDCFEWGDGDWLLECIGPIEPPTK